MLLLHSSPLALLWRENSIATKRVLATPECPQPVVTRRLTCPPARRKGRRPRDRALARPARRTRRRPLAPRRTRNRGGPSPTERTEPGRLRPPSRSEADRHPGARGGLAAAVETRRASAAARSYAASSPSRPQNHARTTRACGCRTAPAACTTSPSASCNSPAPLPAHASPRFRPLRCRRSHSSGTPG
jgi:hypothetical protein